MAKNKHYGPRGAYVLARAGRNKRLRRIGEQLSRKARATARDVAGTHEGGTNEITTRNQFHRNVFREEGAENIAGWFLATCIWLVASALLAGPAIALAWLAYGCTFYAVPKLPRLKQRWGYIAAVITLIAVVVVHIFFPPADTTHTVVRAYIYLQLLVAPLWFSRLVRQRGWQAVQVSQPVTTTVTTPRATPQRVQPIQQVAHVDESPSDPQPQLVVAPRALNKNKFKNN